MLATAATASALTADMRHHPSARRRSSSTLMRAISSNAA